MLRLEDDPFQQQQKELVSDSSSIMGQWYDRKGVDFKFEVNSNVDSIEFPNNQNLNLKLNLQSLDGEINTSNQNIVDDGSPADQVKQPF